MSFGEQLEKIRKRNNMSQYELARLLDVKQYVISTWENDKCEPSLEHLTKICDIFKVPADYLLERESITANSKASYDVVRSHIKMDMNGDFIAEVDTLCKKLNKNQQDAILNIIKQTLIINKEGSE